MSQKYKNFRYKQWVRMDDGTEGEVQYREGGHIYVLANGKLYMCYPKLLTRLHKVERARKAAEIALRLPYRRSVKFNPYAFTNEAASDE